MFIDISEFILNDGELLFRKSGTSLPENLSNDIHIDGPIDYNLLISKVNGELILNIEIEFDYKKPCDRCLTEVSDFESVEYSAKLVEGLEETDSNLYDLDTIVISQNKLDIDSLIRELVTLSIPMKTLCDENCLGLCPKCGKDLNKGNCDCDTEDIDLRFSVLKDLIIDEEV